MRRRTRITAFSAVVCATAAITGGAASASAPPGDDYVLVHDDHGLLQIEVPAAWDQVDTRPFINDDRSLSPAISATAAADFAELTDGYAQPGLVYEARPAAVADEDVFAELDESDRCTDGGRTAYDDGAFTGQLQAWNYCDGGPARTFVLVARPIGQEFTVVLWAKAPTPAAEAHVTHALATFNATPSVGLPTATAPPDDVGGDTVEPAPATSAPATGK